MQTRYTVGDVGGLVNRKLHAGDITQLKDFLGGTLDDARTEMLAKIAPGEMVRTSYIEQALYDQVDKYAVPMGLKYDDVINIRKLSSRRNVDEYFLPLANVYRREFDQKRRDNIFSINWSNGLQTMSIRDLAGRHECQHLIINDANSLTDNGTWNVSGNVENLSLDRLTYITGRGSIRFDINGSSTTGAIEILNQTPVDITDYLQVGAIFSWLYLNYFKIMKSVKLTFGSSQSDTYDFTVNKAHDATEFINMWNLLKFDLDNLNRHGNPNLRSITYCRFDFETTGEPSLGCHIDNIVVRKGVVYEMDYNNAFCFLDADTLAWKQKATSFSDLLPFQEDTYKLFSLMAARNAQKEIYAVTGGNIQDLNGIDKEIADVIMEYHKAHKIEYIEPEQKSNLYGRNRYGYYRSNGNRGWDPNNDNRGDGIPGNN